MLPIVPFFFAPNILYAEIHYRFKYFFSFLFKSEPEILADAPYRIEPDKDLPILIFIKDANLFPIDVLNVKIILSNNKGFKKEFTTSILKRIESSNWFYIYQIKFKSSDPFGFFNIDVKIEIKNKSKIKIISIDNYRTTNKSPLIVFRSKNKLPKLLNFKYGDIHSHSNYTHDQVEFGAPLEASQIISNAIGLSFFGATDHSYDLDDKIDNFLVNDDLLPKWNNFQTEVSTLNKKNNFCTIIRGEEVSCSNSNGKNVHLLLLCNKNYFKGSGDGAEKWFRTKSEFTIEEIVSDISPDTIAISAHPKEKIPFLHKLFFGRDTWSEFDLLNHKLTGMQILNGEINDSFFESKKIWIDLILNGQKILIFAGNDAHGNFNRFRQLSIPFFKIVEKDFQLFGKMKTAVKSISKNEKDIIDSLKNNFSVITSGPLVDFSLSKNNILKYKILSTEEFGTISNLKIIFGDFDLQKETIIFENNFKKKFSLQSSFKPKLKSKNGYYRIEVYTKNGIGNFKNNFCITNPIWTNENKN